MLTFRPREGGGGGREEEGRRYKEFEHSKYESSSEGKPACYLSGGRKLTDLDVCVIAHGEGFTLHPAVHAKGGGGAVRDHGVHVVSLG